MSGDVHVQFCEKPAGKFRWLTLLIICCNKETDANRIKEALGKRLAKYGIKLNEDKTKLVSFSKAKYKQGVKQGCFDYLGFTFYLGKTRRGFIVAKLRTSGKRMRAKLKRVNAWARMVRNKYPLAEIWKRLYVKLQGHIQYYGVSNNCKYINKFLYRVTRIMFKWLNRRSQRKSFNWEKFERFVKQKPLPKVKVVHRLF
jgi:RNA-directed DNA polymerase